VNDALIDVTGVGYNSEENFEINHVKINQQDIPELITFAILSARFFSANFKLSQ